MQLLCNGENISPFLKDWIKGIFYFILFYFEGPFLPHLSKEKGLVLPQEFPYNAYNLKHITALT